MLLKFWFSSTYSRMNFSLVSLLPKINKGLEQARFPHDFSRQARPYCKKWKGSDEKFSMQLSYFLFFTAIEYKNFLLYLYIPVVRELQRNEYQTHTTKLVRALKVLWSRSITNEELDLAERLINEFLADLEKLYGKQAMTYNAHLLAHTFQTLSVCRFWASLDSGLFLIWEFQQACEVLLPWNEQVSQTACERDLNDVCQFIHCIKNQNVEVVVFSHFSLFSFYSFFILTFFAVQR
jgi:hypothetical protein